MSESRSLYLDLMKRCLTYSLWPEAYREYPLDAYGTRWSRPARTALLRTFRRRGLHLMERIPYNRDLRETGRDWPPTAHTMIGTRRLDNLQHCVESVLQENVVGDLIETGVWRGGACIFMRAVLKAYACTNRSVWAADSFAGLPAPDAESYPQDKSSRYHEFSAVLAVSLQEVQANFERYGLLDDQVRFLRGWFKDTLPNAPFAQLAVIRLDGDMYESTMQGLTFLYPKLTPGGYVIVDDYGLEDGRCKAAVDDFRRENSIKEPLLDVDGHAVYWRRTVSGVVDRPAGGATARAALAPVRSASSRA